jgi:hypothetical protein
VFDIKEKENKSLCLPHSPTKERKEKKKKTVCLTLPRRGEVRTGKKEKNGKETHSATWGRREKKEKQKC